MAAEPEIHVIPEQFHGASLKLPAAAVAPAAGAPVDKKSRTLIIILAAGGVFLISLGVGAFFVLRSLETAPTAPTPPPAPAINQNTNANVSVPALNRNVNVNENQNANVNAAPPVAPLTPHGSPDTDFDGLTDAEETELYLSNVAAPDSDSDGFLDGLEVLNLYNPAARAPTRLVDTGLVVEYRDETFGYAVLAPARWQKKILDSGHGSVTFTAGTGEFIQVFAEENPTQKSLADWYLERSPGVLRGELEAVTTKQGYLALRSPDRLTTYIAGGVRVYLVSYNPGPATELNFRRTYEMVVNSFKLQ